MKQAEFRRHHRPKKLTIDGLVWQVIETKPKATNAPVLLMLPGTLGTAEIFWNQIAALGDRVRILSVTYPRIAEIERLADGLARLLDWAGVAKASVVGSSLGGFLGQWFAARHPDRVATLFIGNSLSDPGIVNPSGRPREALAGLPPTIHRDFILASVKSWPEPEPIFAELKAVLTESGTKLLTAQALKARVLAVQQASAVPKLALSPKQIVIIDCADDPLIPAAVQQDVLRRYPGSRHIRLKIGGHYPYVVRPDDYTRILAETLLG